MGLLECYHSINHIRYHPVRYGWEITNDYTHIYVMGFFIKIIKGEEYFSYKYEKSVGTKLEEKSIKN